MKYFGRIKQRMDSKQKSPDGQKNMRQYIVKIKIGPQWMEIALFRSEEEAIEFAKKLYDWTEARVYKDGVEIWRER